MRVSSACEDVPNLVARADHVGRAQSNPGADVGSPSAVGNRPVYCLYPYLSICLEMRTRPHQRQGTHNRPRRQAVVSHREQGQKRIPWRRGGRIARREPAARCVAGVGPVLVQMWQRCPSPGADVAGPRIVPVQMWQGPSPGADVAGPRIVPVQMWQRCPSPGVDVAGPRIVPVQMWQGPSPRADVAGARIVPVQMWQGRAQSRCRCGRGEPSGGPALRICRGSVTRGSARVGQRRAAQR